jgi:ABC-type cobalamin transport system ATPase subunit
MGNGQHIEGPANEVLTETALSQAFQFDIKKITHQGHLLFFPAGFSAN